MAVHSLSKSRFTAGLQCHRLLWWKVFEPNAPDRNVQSGWSASALSVRQMPPPAAPIQSLQLAGVHTFEIAIAVVRPEARYSLPCRLRIGGYTPGRGPSGAQWSVAFLLAALSRILVKAARAVCRSTGVTSVPG